MKIAIIHDCFREYGGAERVVEVLHEMWPTAPVYTSFIDLKGLGRHAERFSKWNIQTSWLQQHWILKKFISPFRFLIPLVWKKFDFSSFDVVISSSGWFMSRGAVRRNSKFEIRNLKRKPIHICYIHHPPRNMYGYVTGSTLQRYPIVRAYSTVVNFFLRHYDFWSAQQVDYFVANSKETARRVEKFYRRTSTVIYPPISINPQPVTRNPKQKRKASYYLSVGRLAWSKRVDLAILACNTLHLPLKIVGAGKEERRLRLLAGPSIEFVGSVSDRELDTLYRNAKALIFTALDEDFGMVPVEAMAHGTPVIALGEGGVKETILDGKTGVLFEKADGESLCGAIKKFEIVDKNTQWDEACSSQAQKFSKKEFKKKITSFIQKTVFSPVDNIEVSR